MRKQEVTSDFTFYEHDGLRLLLPQGFRVKAHRCGTLFAVRSHPWEKVSVNVLASPDQMNRAEEALRRLARSAPESDLALIRQRPVTVPYPGFETIQHSHPIGGGPTYFWGLFLRAGPLAAEIKIIGDGEFNESAEAFWRNVIESISVAPRAVAQPLPQAPHGLTPEEVQSGNQRAIRQALRRVRKASEVQDQLQAPVSECTVSGVLRQFDACAQTFTFPILDNGHCYLADTRLSAYGDRKNWAVIIEALGYNPRALGHERFADALYCFGNCLTGAAGLAEDGFIWTTSDGADGPLFDPSNELNPEPKSIRIRGVDVPINRDPAFLASKRIGPEFEAEQLRAYAMRQKGSVRKNLLEAARRLENAEAGHGLRGQDLLRSLVPEHRNLLLAADGELSQRLSVEIPLLLRLDQWHHPDITAGKLPGKSETFKMIAEELASGDASRYKPKQEPNTHWSNWPMGGEL